MEKDKEFPAWIPKDLTRVKFLEVVVSSNPPFENLIKLINFSSFLSSELVQDL
jgi:hypothetical protein